VARYNVNPETVAGGRRQCGPLIRGIIIADHADLSGGHLETGSILLSIALNQVTAVGCADSFRLPEAR